MTFRKFIIILPLLWAFNVKAQEPQAFASAMPEQWQLTLDVIKSKAQTLMFQNNGLQVEYRQLIRQMQQLRQSIDGQQKTNEQMEQFLKERHGRTDQQVSIEELTQAMKLKKQAAVRLQEQLGNLNTKQTDLDRKIQQLKHTIANIEIQQQQAQQQAKVSANTALPQGDDLTPWRKQLEDENRQEVLLGNELNNLKSGGNMQNLNVDAIEDQNKELEARLDVLRLQKVRHMKTASDATLTEANALKYDQLKKRKDELEAQVGAYEARLGELRESTLMTLSWSLKKKTLVHEMVQTDAHNNQMRDNIKVLREDINVLRDQVARLERRLDFAKAPTNNAVDLQYTP